MQNYLIFKSNVTDESNRKSRKMEYSTIKIKNEYSTFNEIDSFQCTMEIL